MTTSMAVVWLLVSGLVVGGIARFVIPAEDQAGPRGTLVLAVLGSLVAGLLGVATGCSTAFSQTVASVTGAVLMLAAFHYLVGRNTGMR
jgi:uncharacterized membrane protein YeaQ/YmgE (transglycosylase-associated protein family)